MATYTVIQDIEAEDHILGPLTLKQFIYALISALFFYFSFLVATKNAAFLLIIFLPPALTGAFLAFPFKRDQPTEIWALSKIRFLIKPRTKIWAQSGVTSLVTITAPKKVEHLLTKNLSESEVKSRLEALAATIDSRGWAVKNLGISQAQQLVSTPDSQRLIDINSIPKPVPDETFQPGDDMLDEQNNPLYETISDLTLSSDKAHREKLIETLNSIRQQNKQQTAIPAAGQTQQSPTTQVIAPAQEDEIIRDLKEKEHIASLANANLSRLSNNAPNMTDNNTNITTQAVRPSMPDPAKINLAFDNDKTISVISNEANRLDADDNEVVVNLHNS